METESVLIVKGIENKSRESGRKWSIDPSWRFHNPTQPVRIYFDLCDGVRDETARAWGFFVRRVRC